ncbi:MAG: glycosyltransferase family 9 protein [Terriglobales bacterium]
MSAITASVRRILVVRLSAMGDVLHTMPAVAALNRLFPRAFIGWAIEERWAELLCSREAARRGPRSLEKPLVDTLHIVNTRNWRRAPFSDETWKEVLGAVREIRELQYDVAIDFQGAIRSAVLAQLSRAPELIGFRSPREHVASMFYNRQVIAEGRHIVEQNLSLLTALTRSPLPAASECAAAVELPFDPINEQWAEGELAQLDFCPGQFAILNPGAGWGAKCWPAERYGEVARALGEIGLKSLVNMGPGEEPLAHSVVQVSGGVAKAVPYTVGELIALTRRARLFIGGDTGPVHLAAALRVPVVAIFGPTDPARNGPYSPQTIVLRSPESRTSHARRVQPDEALLSISTADVINAARRLLDQSQSNGAPHLGDRYGSSSSQPAPERRHD